MLKKRHHAPRVYSSPKLVGMGHIEHTNTRMESKKKSEPPKPWDKAPEPPRPWDKAPEPPKPWDKAPKPPKPMPGPGPRPGRSKSQ